MLNGTETISLRQKYVTKFGSTLRRDSVSTVWSWTDIFTPLIHMRIGYIVQWACTQFERFKMLATESRLKKQ